jgi:hypothetical protein
MVIIKKKFVFLFAGRSLKNLPEEKRAQGQNYGNKEELKERGKQPIGMKRIG